ncbi:MAG: hypothetical protein KJO07_04200 [Deltaproteobacteria bacterium]|nr:hypothetical protein [Deltaproteobacteria bacterium]
MVPGARVVDLTSRAEPPFVRLSPFYPHGAIPVPFSPGRLAMSVEGIWQGLKVFEHEDVDLRKLDIATMKGIKRSATRSRGRVLGHRRGTSGVELLGYREARHAIYLPVYSWVLEKRVAELVAELITMAEAGPLVLLDYETNGDVDDLSRPLSHAALVARWLQDGVVSQLA